MIVKLMTVRTPFRVSKLKSRCRGSSQSTHVKMPHYWKSHALAQMIFGLTIKLAKDLGPYCFNRTTEK